MTSHRPIKSIRAASEGVVLVCRKCERKLKGGFGPDGDLPFAKALARATAKPGKAAKKKAAGRKAAVAVFEVDCLDICPKGAVVAISGSVPGTWFAVPRGTPMDEVTKRLGLTGSAKPEAPARAGPERSGEAGKPAPQAGDDGAHETPIRSDRSV